MTDFTSDLSTKYSVVGLESIKTFAQSLTTEEPKVSTAEETWGIQSTYFIGGAVALAGIYAWARRLKN